MKDHKLIQFEHEIPSGSSLSAWEDWLAYIAREVEKRGMIGAVITRDETWDYNGTDSCTISGWVPLNERELAAAKRQRSRKRATAKKAREVREAKELAELKRLAAKYPDAQI